MQRRFPPARRDWLLISFLRNLNLSSRRYPAHSPSAISLGPLTSNLQHPLRSTVAHDLLHDIGQLPRQDLAIEMSQNVAPAVHPEFLAAGGIVIQR